MRTTLAHLVFWLVWWPALAVDCVSADAVLKQRPAKPAAELDLDDLEQQIANDQKDAPAPAFLPDLVRRAGAEKSEAFLRRVLVLPGLTDVVATDGAATRALAVKVALELAPQAGYPFWSLTYGLSPDEIALHETLDRRFPRNEKLDRTEDPTPRLISDQWYLRGLIAAHRFGEAGRLAALLGQNDSGVFRYFVDAALDFARQGVTVLRDLLLLRRDLAHDPEAARDERRPAGLMRDP